MRGPGRFFRDTGLLAKSFKFLTNSSVSLKTLPIKGYGIFLYIFKGIRDTWINLRGLGIQCFLKFGDICHIYFRDMGYFSK